MQLGLTGAQDTAWVAHPASHDCVYIKCAPFPVFWGDTRRAHSLPSDLQNEGLSGTDEQEPQSPADADRNNEFPFRKRMCQVNNSNKAGDEGETLEGGGSVSRDLTEHSPQGRDHRGQADRKGR